MRIGILDRRILLQRATVTSDVDGAPIETWSALAPHVWATAPKTLRQEERSTVAQWIAREQVSFQIRWQSALADLYPLDRIIYPAEDSGESPIPTMSIYDVMGVREIGRRNRLEILCARQSDVMP